MHLSVLSQSSFHPTPYFLVPKHMNTVHYLFNLRERRTVPRYGDLHPPRPTVAVGSGGVGQPLACGARGGVAWGIDKLNPRKTQTAWQPPGIHTNAVGVDDSHTSEGPPVKCDPRPSAACTISRKSTASRGRNLFWDLFYFAFPSSNFLRHARASNFCSDFDDEEAGGRLLFVTDKNKNKNTPPPALPKNYTNKTPFF